MRASPRIPYAGNRSRGDGALPPRPPPREEGGGGEEELRGQRRRRGAGRRRARRRVEPQLYVNYTDIPLTPAMKEVLNKGPTFVPDRPQTNLMDVAVGHGALKRNMRWDEFFQRIEMEAEEGGEEQAQEEQEERILKDKVPKVNLPRGHPPPKALQAFECANSHNLSSPANLRKKVPNFSPRLRGAVEDLVSLQREREVVLKQTDKTGCWAVMPFESYDISIKEKLQETFLEGGVEKPKYPPSSQAKLKKEHKALTAMIREGVTKGFIGEKDAAAAMPDKPTAGRLYGLPKDHKPVRPETGLPPLREVVSCSGGNLEGPGKIVDNFLQRVDEQVPTFLRDTPHLLRKIEELHSLGPPVLGSTRWT